MMMGSPGLYGEVYSEVMVAVDGNEGLAKELTGEGVSWPSACDSSAGAAAVEGQASTNGPGSAGCTAALEQRANKVEITALITGLTALGISNGNVVEAHDDYGDDYEKAGWNNFSGGSNLQNSVGRPNSLVEAKNALARANPEEALSLVGLKALAGAAVAHSSGQSDAAANFQDVMENLLYKKASSSTQALGGIFFFFILMGFLFKLRASCAGYVQMAITLMTALVIMLFISSGGTAALKALSLEGASGGTFDTLLGPFAAVLSQILVFIQKLVGVVSGLDWKFLILAATFWMVVHNGSKWVFAGGVYVLLTYESWFNFLQKGNDLAFSPFNPDAFDASFILPPLVWALEVGGMIVGLYLLVGAWRHLGQPAIDKVGELCSTYCGDCSDEPAAPAAPAPPAAPSAPSYGSEG
ncbi:MAG TPA: hypothetical protein EYN66_13125 [Myxococcales bacterium]|nr:hypothetical protein [Myxococcales bacterium]